MSVLRPLVPLLALALAALVAGCGGTPTRTTAGDRPANPLAEGVTISAIGLVGTPYRYGGNTPAGGFDCSGLIGHVFRQGADLTLPRTVGELAQGPWRRVPPGQLGSGDLVFFAPDGRRLTHAGIYVGAGRFVHAPSSGGTVRLDRLDQGYWQARLRYGLRPLP
jgi:cell wall-associated NlpC family hydrolase